MGEGDDWRRASNRSLELLRRKGYERDGQDSEATRHPDRLQNQRWRCVYVLQDENIRTLTSHGSVSNMAGGAPDLSYDGVCMVAEAVLFVTRMHHAAQSR